MNEKDDIVLEAILKAIPYNDKDSIFKSRVPSLKNLGTIICFSKISLKNSMKFMRLKNPKSSKTCTFQSCYEKAMKISKNLKIFC